jgi:hypothetical protein
VTARSYVAEPDPEPGGRAVIVRVSSDPGENGTVVGWVAGPRPMARAILAARIICQTDRQIGPETAGYLRYTPAGDFGF